jgi:hypothetical protein
MTKSGVRMEGTTYCGKKQSSGFIFEVQETGRLFADPYKKILSNTDFRIHLMVEEN